MLFWPYLALLVWAPIPLGSNRPWAWSVLEVGAFALTALWLVAWGLGQEEAPQALRRSLPAWALLSLWIVLQAFEVVPLPASWVAFLSPEAARVHAFAADAGAALPAKTTLSVDAHGSLVSLLKTLAYACVFFLTLALASRRSRILVLVQVLVYAAVGQAVYAVLMHLGDANGEYFGTFIAHSESASGTYANRNHLAGYLEMTLALGIGLLIAGISERSADSWRKFVRLTLDWILSPKMVLRLSLCILVIALTTTHSRSGNAAFFASLLIAGVIGIALSRHATRNTVLLLASLIAIDLFIVGSWFGLEKLAQRIEATTASDVRVREAPAAYTLPIIRDYPLFGSGPGSFHVVFPRYRPPTVPDFHEEAHNDYAQLAAESGVPGFVLLGGFVLLALGCAVLAQARRRDPLMRGVSFACMMGVTSILIHSWTDFNLQIPANAALFMVLLALGWISLYHDRQAALANVRDEER